MDDSDDSDGDGLLVLGLDSRVLDAEVASSVKGHEHGGRPRFLYSVCCFRIVF